MDIITIAAVLEKLESVKPAAGGKNIARCPAHDDNSPSLSIAQGDDGRILLHCHAGCKTEAIVAAIGLTMADLMPPRDDQRPRNSATGKKPKKTFPTARDAVAALERQLGPRTALYTYHDHLGGMPPALRKSWER